MELQNLALSWSQTRPEKCVQRNEIDDNIEEIRRKEKGEDENVDYKAHLLLC